MDNQNCCGCDCVCKPTIVVKDLSINTQPYLQVEARPQGQPNVVFIGAADQGPVNHYLKFIDLTTLVVDYCIHLDPCCTSRISFDTSQGLADFLAQDLSTLATQEGRQQYKYQKFLMGNYNCDASCC